MPLPDLDILVAILDTGSLRAAADLLALPRATLSRRLAKLEEDVGARLIHRTTRALVPTEAGLELYRHARPIVDAVGAATAAVRAHDGVPRGLLRVTVPPGTGSIFGGVFAQYLDLYPEVRMEVLAVTRHVDLVAEGFDVGVRAGELTGSSLLSRRLAATRSTLVASPAYLARAGAPTHVSELAEHDCLVGFARGEVPHQAWPLPDGTETPVRPRYASNDLGLLVHAALRGVGLALLPAGFVEADVLAGRLVEVLPGQVGQESGIWLVYPEKRLMLPRVRAFIDLLMASLATTPFPTRPV